jgi:hypothetical protein
MADIRVRVGQENAIKVVASVSGSAGGRAVTAENVIGGIGSITQLSVSGSVSIGGSLSVGQFSVDKFSAGIASVTDKLYYPTYKSGVAYFDPSGLVVSTGAASTTNSIDYSNYVLTTNNVGIITWTSVLDGGTY